jgi:DnaJ-class molecular chaperone
MGDGRGDRRDASKVTCPICGGEGYTPLVMESTGVTLLAACDECGGTGQIDDESLWWEGEA